jgi:hypothetical protein
MFDYIINQSMKIIDELCMTWIHIPYSYRFNILDQLLRIDEIYIEMDYEIKNIFYLIIIKTIDMYEEDKIIYNIDYDVKLSLEILFIDNYIEYLNNIKIHKSKEKISYLIELFDDYLPSIIEMIWKNIYSYIINIDIKEVDMMLVHDFMFEMKKISMIRDNHNKQTNYFELVD